MSADQDKAIVRHFVQEGGANKNLNWALEALTHPSFIVHLPGAPDPMDRAAFQRFTEPFHAAFSDEHIQIEEQLAEGDKVASRLIYTATHTGEFYGIPPTGKQVRISMLWIDRLVDGKIIERWGQFDALGLMQQLGAIPTPER